MKIRLEEKMIRFRISPEEREELNAGNQVIMHAHLSVEHPLEICLCIHKGVHDIACGFDGSRICVELAAHTLEALNAAPEKGIQRDFPAENPMVTILVEQDRPLRRK